MKPTPKRQLGLHIEDVKAGIRKKHGSAEALADKMGVHKVQLSKALRTRSSLRVDVAIAKALGMRVEDLFLDRANNKEQERHAA